MKRVSVVEFWPREPYGWLPEASDGVNDHVWPALHDPLWYPPLIAGWSPGGVSPIDAEARETFRRKP